MTSTAPGPLAPRTRVSRIRTWHDLQVREFSPHPGRQLNQWPFREANLSGWLGTRTVLQGTHGIITDLHPGPLGGYTHVDVRLPKGEFLREVLVDYFLA
jgi:hypothetical protein